MNQTVAAAERHIADIEARVARQLHVVEMLAKSGLDSTKAKHTLHILEETLALTREHVRILLPARERLSDGLSAEHPN